MANVLIVDNRYYSYTLIGAIKHMNKLSEDMKEVDDREYLTYLLNDFYDLNYYVEQFANTYSEYVTRRQLIKICKYRGILNKLKEKLQKFSFSDTEFSLTSYFNNKEMRDTIIGKMQYYSDEYSKYVNSIGYELNDTTQDKQLYELLNN